MTENIERALDIWDRRKWLGLAVAASVTAAAVSVARSLPNLYRARATVLVERQQVSEELVRPTVTAEFDTRLQTIREDVMSRTRLGDLISRMNLYPEARRRAPLDAVVERMRRDIQLDVKSVESQASGRISTIAFAISYSGRNPETVARVANALAVQYVDGNTKIREGQASRTAEFLKAQLADIRSELDRYEARITDFNAGHAGEMPEQTATNLASLDRLNTQLRLNGESQMRALDRRERLERQQAEPAATPAPPRVSPDADRLARLQQQLQELRTRFTDAYPEVVRVRADIAALARQLAAHPAPEPVSAADPDASRRLLQAIASIDAELLALKNEERSMRQAIAAYEQRIEIAPKRRQEVQELSRDYAAIKERHDTLLKRYEEARLAESLEQGRKVEQFRILDAAIPPRDPVAPNRFRLLALGLLLAAGLAIGAVLAAEKLDTAFHSVDELRAFVSVPALARVPLLRTRSRRRRARMRALILAASAAAGLLLIVAGTHFVATGNEQLVRMMDRGH